MGTRRKLLVLAIVFLAFVSVVQAGVYSTIEPKWKLGGNEFRRFQEYSLTPLKQLASPNADLEWQKYCNLVATALLIAKEPPTRGQPDPLKPQERLDLGVCLLRIRYPGKQMPEKAIGHLKAATERDRENFLALSTLGTAYQMIGDYLSADGELSEAWRYWSKPFDRLSPKQQAFLKDVMKWTKEDFAWYGKCEQYQRRLVRLRYRELKKGTLTFAKALEHLDPLFDPSPAPAGYKPISFVGESGKFELGKIAAAEKAKLPPDAIEIVEQLLVWTPDDLRLFWLLGELLNAKGDIDDAKIVFREFLGKFSQMPEFQGLANIDPKTGQPIVDAMSLLPKFVERHPQVGTRLQALLDYAPPPPVAPDESVKVAENPKPVVQTKKEEPVVAPLKLDWQTLSVGLGAGALVGFLFAWRVRDLLRRRQPREATHNK